MTGCNCVGSTGCVVASHTAKSLIPTTTLAPVVSVLRKGRPRGRGGNRQTLWETINLRTDRLLRRQNI